MCVWMQLCEGECVYSDLNCCYHSCSTISTSALVFVSICDSLPPSRPPFLELPGSVFPHCFFLACNLNRTHLIFSGSLSFACLYAPPVSPCCLHLARYLLQLKLTLPWLCPFMCSPVFLILEKMPPVSNQTFFRSLLSVFLPGTLS